MIPPVIGACRKCFRGYISFTHAKCRYCCVGNVGAIEPVANNFNFSKRWEPMPHGLVKFVMDTGTDVDLVKDE